MKGLERNPMVCNLAKVMLIATVVGVSAQKMCAQESAIPEIATERPAVGAAPEVVPEGMLQVETGVGIGYTKTSYVADFPESLARWGIGHRVELRLMSSNGVYQPNPDAGEKKLQSQDMAFGAKAGMAPANSIVPQAAVMMLNCPTGGAAYTSGTFDPSLIFVWQQIARRGFVLTENIGAVRSTAEDKRKTIWVPGIAVGHEVTHIVAAYVEYAPSFTAGESPIHIVDGGVTYRRTPDSQIDVKVGYQQDATGGRNLFSIGYSRRLDGTALASMYRGILSLAD